MRDILIDPWMQTYSGKVVSLLDPKPSDFLITDIALALSNICRFTGHTKFFYSVAQHSILVSRAVSRKNALWGLMHDASEAYLGDVSRPVKLYLNGKYLELEKLFMAAICDAFAMNRDEPDEVKEADKVLVVTERRDLLTEQGVDWGFTQKPLEGRIKYVDPHIVRWRFIAEFVKICKRGMA